MRGPALSRSGYGVNTRFILRALRKYEQYYDIYIHNTPWGKTGWVWEDSEERRWVDLRIKDTVHWIQNGGTFDISVQCTIPGEFERLAPFNIGVTAGTETTKISPLWVEKCNQVLNKLIVVSEHTAYAFRNTRYLQHDQSGNVVAVEKVHTSIEVVNYPVEPVFVEESLKSGQYEKLCQELNNTLEQLPTKFNFLLASQWSVRKNFEDTIRWWVDAFRENEQVGLVVKTCLMNNSEIDRSATADRLAGFLSSLGERKCSVYLLHGDLVDEQMATLYQHENIRGIVNISHGEGFSLPLFEAVSSGLPVVSVNWSGQLDFLCPREQENEEVLFCPVDFELGPIQENAVWDTVLERHSLWAYPKEESFKSQLVHFFSNYSQYWDKAQQLKNLVNRKFEQQKMYDKLVEAFGMLPEVAKNDNIVVVE